MSLLDSNEEYAAVATRPTDEQNRVVISALTDREIAEETLTYLRLMSDLMTQVASNPMLSKMFPLPPGLKIGK